VEGNACIFEIITGYYIYTMLLQVSACKKRTPKASQEAKELSIKPVCGLRMNHLEERGNGTIKVRSDSNFYIKFPTVPFYVIEHNFKSNSWIKLNLYQTIPKALFYVGINV
jgi:hypothetical protein